LRGDALIPLQLAWCSSAFLDVVRSPRLWQCLLDMHFPGAGASAGGDDYRGCFAQQWRVQVTEKRARVLLRFGLHSVAPAAPAAATASAAATNRMQKPRPDDTHKIAGRLAM
jgi:hypothetical protein